MRRILLFIVGFSVINSLYAARTVKYELEKHIKSELDARGLTDIWTNIKNSSKNAWDAIKNIAKNTKDKIKQWIENVKDIARNAKERMKNRISDIRKKSKIALEKLIGTGQQVKICFQKENEALEQLLTEIINYVTTCVSDALLNIKRLEERGLQLQLNDTNFISDIETKMNQCVTQKDVEECLNTVRKDIYSSMEDVESKVLTSRMESRSITDDIIDTVTSCSIKGLIDSSNVIATESIEIIKCVVNA